MEEIFQPEEFQKLEQLKRYYFSFIWSNKDLIYQRRQSYTTNEWFIAPLAVIEQAIELIINGKIVNYRYDGEMSVNT